MYLRDGHVVADVHFTHLGAILNIPDIFDVPGK